MYSFSCDTRETEVCPHDIRGEAPEVHPRLFYLRINLGQMCLHDLASSMILAPSDLLIGWNAMYEEFLKENFNQEPTGSSGACGIFTTAKDPEYIAAFCHVKM